MIERLTTITELPVDEIHIRNRLRDVYPGGVATLVEAIRAQGFVGRILVRRTRTGDEVLNGAHRLTAMRELGARTIPCDVVRCSDAEARMYEIDGNLAGADLTVLDEAYFLARRREAIQKLHPETRQGYAGAAGRWTQVHFSALAKAIAEKRGIKVRQAYNIMAAGTGLSEGEYHRLKSAPKPVALHDLLALRKADPNLRPYAIDLFAEGKADKIARAVKMARAVDDQPAPVDKVDTEFLALLKVWQRAGKAARDRFVAHRLGALAEAVAEAERARHG